MRVNSRMPVTLTVAALLLVACQDAPSINTPPAISYKNLSPIGLAVGTVKVTEEYLSTSTTPYVEHEIDIPPAEGVKIWVNDRLRAMGGENSAEVLIKDASIKEVPLQLTGGLEGWMKREQALRFDGRIEVEVKIFTPARLMSEASISVKVTRSHTLVEGASAYEREQRLNTLNKEMLDALNAELEKTIRQYLAAYLTT